MPKQNENDDFETLWTVEGVIAEKLQIPEWSVKNVVNLLSEGCTIPFIARYRKEMTGNTSVDNLHAIENNMQELNNVSSKIRTVCNSLKKLGSLTPDMLLSLRSANTMMEVEMLYAPYKPGHKGTLAARAKALGLEPLALALLSPPFRCDLSKNVDRTTKGLKTEDEIMKGIEHILADIINRDRDVMNLCRHLCKNNRIKMECSAFRGLKKKLKQDKENNNKSADKSDVHKFEQFFNFSCPVYSLHPHQVLAINRGEDKKILSVQIVFPPEVEREFIRTASKKFVNNAMNELCKKMMNTAIEDARTRLVEPHMTRTIRSMLNKEAEAASIDVFAKNLKHLLLTQPVKGLTVFAIDPGYKNGCKAAVVSSTGQILMTAYLYLMDKAFKQKIKDIIKNYKCNIVAIGDGHGCRDTEKVVADIVKQSDSKLQYCIVNESGASIYSVTKLAEKDLPDLEPSLRSAVSLARRVIDPLAEYIKVEPKHLGVGQYQHDMPEKQLQTSLDAVIEECVSFVGVDLNTASEHLLSRVAGLSSAKAKSIIERRESRGPFTNRKQLKFVKGIGGKTFQQCAGFVRVHLRPVESIVTISSDDEKTPNVAGTSRKRKNSSGKGKKSPKVAKLSREENPLDSTAIHPESYETAQKLMDMVGLVPDQLGAQSFIDKLEQYTKVHDIHFIAKNLKIGEPTAELIVEALKRPNTYDYREAFQKPVFKSFISSIEDLKIGEILSGRVTNVTHFGAFVDIGVGPNGLIHISQMKGNELRLGQHVEVRVQSKEVERKRISLIFEKFL